MRILLAVVLIAFAGNAAAQTPEIEARYEKLAHDLRCLVCQNQSLAESSADLAEDLKREVKSLIAKGQTDAQIKTFLSVRYGDFILYKPPMQGNTVVLWVGPFLALAVGVCVGLLYLRKRGKATPHNAASPQIAPTLSAADEAELRRRLDA